LDVFYCKELQKTKELNQFFDRDMKNNKKQKHPVDVHVGYRLRLKRQEKRISQEELGNFAGVTFQQIQKYEKGDNRISCSRLVEFARFLNTDISYFFEGLDVVHGGEEINTQESPLLANDETATLEEAIKLLRKLNSPRDRRRVLDLIARLSKEQQDNQKQNNSL
jgi:transcriptional regulator with XRE-family HTH domain